MKKTVFFWSMLAALGVLATTATQAQAQTSTTTTTTNYVQTTKIVGMKVKGSNGEEIGTIKDVVLDRDTGCMAYTVISTGGGGGTRVTGTTKTVAVPWKVYTTSSDPSVMTVTVDRERIYNAPAFEYSRINEYSTSGYINNVYSYYGVQPTVGVGVGVNTGVNTGAQTGVSAQTNTAVSPAPAVSASPSMPPSATVSPSASATVSPGATAKVRATAETRRPSVTPSERASERRSSPERSEEET